MQIIKKTIQLLSLVFISTTMVFCQNNTNTKEKMKTVTMNTQKMKVEIWSDIMCPFCYIGKRHYEEALQKFAYANNIEIEWHSFQLDPSLPKPASKLNTYQYLAERKGMTYEQSVGLHKNVVEMAKQAGLNYNFDKAVVANSFDAHRLIQLAKTKGLGDEAEERLFKAYFMEGKDMSDAATLISLGKEIGLDEATVSRVINSKEYTDEVNRDIAEAQQIGVQGVPFFVFNRKFALSGAQPSSTFLDVLKKSFEEWHSANPESKLEVIEGKVCTPNIDCN
jgi:predicted DsbA family dithiol-disulfide isomerase